MLHKSSKCGTAIVSCHDLANEAWLYMEQCQLHQVDVIAGDSIIGTLTKDKLDKLSREDRLRLDVRDLLNEDN